MHFENNLFTEAWASYLKSLEMIKVIQGYNYQIKQDFEFS